MSRWLVRVSVAGRCGLIELRLKRGTAANSCGLEGIGARVTRVAAVGRVF